MSPKLRTFLMVFALAVTLDVSSKLWVVNNVELTDRIPVVGSFIQLTHVRNPGGAFGLFDDASNEWRRIAFGAVSIAAALLILSFYVRLAPGDRITAAALASILGGAVGNGIDRVLRGEVVDFLHFQLWRGFPWPDFNLADTFIILGVATLILDLVSSEAASRAQQGPPPTDG